MGIGATSSRASAEEVVRRHAGGGEGAALLVLKANRPGRATFAADPDARGALHPELAEAGDPAEPARRGAEHTQQAAIRDKADSSEARHIRGTPLYQRVYKSLDHINIHQVFASRFSSNSRFFQEITRDIEGVEALVAQVNSLQHKLGGTNDSKEFTSFLIQLMRGKEVSVPGGSRGDIGSRITTMFRDAQRVNFPRRRRVHLYSPVSLYKQKRRKTENKT